MKPGIVFLLVVAIVLFFILRTDPFKVQLFDNMLIIGNKSCKVQIPVKPIEQSRDAVQEISIVRNVLELPNADRVILEQVDLPPKESFDKAYNEIVETIFDMPVEEIFSKDGVVIYRGKFDVALFYKTRHELVLLYPADDLTQMIISCATQKKKEGLRKFSKEPVMSRWSVKQIILDGLINKDI
jgi:hypothetical protein